jgi:hypothetical protein
MSAQIVFDDGSPTVGSKDNGSLTAITLSNFDDTGVAGWEWEIVDRPQGSAAVLSDPNDAAPTFTPDVRGTYLVRLQTYADAALETLDDADEQVYAIRLAGAYDWRVPAAGETSQLDSTRGWAAARETAIRDVHAFMTSGVPALMGATNEETTVLGSEVLLGGFAFDGGNLPALTAYLRLIGLLTTSTPGTTASLRLYDMGSSSAPSGPGVLRSTATIPYASANTINMQQVALDIVASPGVGADEVHDAERLYELRMIIQGGTAGDTLKVHWGGLVLLGS